jgi:hypothetical protein
MNNKIKIQRNTKTDEKLVKSAVILLVLAIGMYMYMNISVVFNLISYKKTKLKYEQKGEMYVVIENDINKIKSSLKIEDATKLGLEKLSSSNFAVRKDYLGSFSFNYEMR